VICKINIYYLFINRGSVGGDLMFMWGSKYGEFNCKDLKEIMGVKGEPDIIDSIEKKRLQ